MELLFSRILSNKFVQGGLLLIVANAIVSIFNYTFNIITAKFLGPEIYGEIVALFSYLLILSSPLQIMSLLLIKRLGSTGKHKFEVAETLEKWIFIKIKKYWYLLLPYFALFLYIPRLTNLLPLTSLFLLLLLLFTFYNIFYSSALQGIQLFLIYSILIVISFFVKLLGAITALIAPNGLFAILLFLSISTLTLPLLASYYLYKRRKAVKKKTNTYKFSKRINEVIFNKSAVIILFATIGMTLIANADIIYVKKFFPSSTAGIYGAWSLFAKIVLYIFGPIMSLTFVFFSDTNEKRRHKKLLILSSIIFIFLGMIIYILYAIFGNSLIRLLFTSKYLEIVPLLPSAAIFGSLYTLVMLLNNYFIAKKGSKAMIIFYLSPLYILLLFLFADSIQKVININIIYSLILILAYTVFLLKMYMKHSPSLRSQHQPKQSS